MQIYKMAYNGYKTEITCLKYQVIARKNKYNFCAKVK